MSSPNILSVNSGPLIIRTYNDLTSNNTYLLNQYDYPISSNYVLITSANGQLIPTSSPTISSITIGSTITGLQISQLSTISTNYLSTPLIVGSTIQCSGTAVFRNLISTINITSLVSTSLDSNHYGKYLFITGTTNNTTILLPNSPPDGTNITIRNIMESNTVSISSVNGPGSTKVLQNTGSTVNIPNTIALVSNSNTWYSLSNF